MEPAAELAAFLGKTILFGELPFTDRAAVASALERVELVKGDVLFAAGTPGERAFVIRAGTLHVVDATGPGGRILAELGRGDHVGEMAVLTGEPRAAGVVAAVDAVLYAIPGPLLRALFERHPILYARLSLGLMRQLQRRPEQAPGARTVALVGVGAAAAAAPRLARALAAVLAARGERVTVLECSGTSAPPPSPPLAGDLDDLTVAARRIVTATPPGPEGVTIVRADGADTGDSAVTTLLAELRRRATRVLVHAALPWSAPVARALAQCEVVYWLVARGERDAGRTCREEMARLERVVHAPLAGRTLLLGSGSATPAETVGASRALPVGAAGDGLDAPPAARALRALAREITARQTALVLGAGGAKGFAHVGALRVFARHALEFDAVAGTSIGAIVGALVAMGWGAAEIETLFLGIARNPWSTLLDPRVPTEAFFRSKKKTELLEQYCGDRRIEELELPFFAVAGDLGALIPVVFDRGPLALALDATSAIPTVFRPVRHEGQILVDGWVCDPLPAGVARARRFDRVVAVDLSPRGEVGGAGATVPRRLEGRFRILAIAMRAMELASREHVTRSLPLVDVLIRPDLDGFSSADVGAASEMADRGERAAEDALAALADAPPAR